MGLWREGRERSDSAVDRPSRPTDGGVRSGDAGAMVAVHEGHGVDGRLVPPERPGPLHDQQGPEGDDDPPTPRRSGLVISTAGVDRAITAIAAPIRATTSGGGTRFSSGCLRFMSIVFVAFMDRLLWSTVREPTPVRVAVRVRAAEVTGATA